MRRLRPGTETPAEVHHEIPIPKSPGLTVERSSLARETGPWGDAPLVVVVLTIRPAAAAKLEPYLRADGAKVWSLMQLERQLRPEAYGRRRGGYLDRRRMQSAAPRQHDPRT
jgi:hypothetical protein